MKQPIHKNSWRWTCKCPKHVEAIYENKIIVTLFASSWYIFLTYIYDARSHIKWKHKSKWSLLKVYCISEWMIYNVQIWLVHRLLWIVVYILVYMHYNRSGIPASTLHSSRYLGSCLAHNSPHVQDISQHFIFKCTLFIALTGTWWITTQCIQTLLDLRPSQNSCRR